MRFPEITYETKYLEDLNIDELHRVAWLAFHSCIVPRQAVVAIRTEIEMRGLDDVYEKFCKTNPFEGVKVRPFVVV